MSWRRASRPARFAFTLLEVLIAIALLMGLVTALFAFGFDMLASRQTALQYAWRQRAAATLIERLEADLMSCVAALRTESGVRGDESSITILTRGVAASLAERSADDGDVFGDLQRTEYRFDSQSHQIQARRTPWGSTVAGDSAFVSMGGRIERVRFRYFDGATWESSFDSLSVGRLPRAVEVAIWFNADADEPLADATGSEEISSAGFDESAFADRADRDSFSAPMPDRLRVILIPDATVAADATKWPAHIEGGEAS
jgi:type II secretory pathway component PulJ